MKIFSSLRFSRLFWRIVGIFLFVLLLLNVLIWRQVHVATHFAPTDQPVVSLQDVPFPQQVGYLFTGVPMPRPINIQTPQDRNLPYTVESIPLANQEYLEAWLIAHPSSLGTVIMFPGYAGSKEQLLTPAEYMYQFGYSSLVVDFRGSGGSSRNDTTIGMREAKDVAAAVEYVQHKWPQQPVILYGISMGGASILRAIALEGVTPTAIIVEGVFDRFLTTVRHRFDVVGTGFPAGDLLLFWGSIETGYNTFAHNPVDFATHITVPTLIMLGESDPWISQAEGERVAQAIAAPVTFVIIPDTGHAMPFVIPAPDLWVEKVQAFLKTIR